MADNEWETEIYARGRQLNRWPFSELVSDITRLTVDVDRSMLSVLDLGCGAGNNTWFLLDSGFDVCGLDISPTAVQFARDRLRRLGFDGADLRVGSATHLPWDEGRFDLVVDRGTLCQLVIDDVGTVTSEVDRVLKAGGLFLSYNLLGWNSSDRELGEEFTRRSFHRFTGGRMAKNPMATFFDEFEIAELWKPLQVDRLIRHVVTEPLRGTTEEHFTVHASKPVSADPTTEIGG